MLISTICNKSDLVFFKQFVVTDSEELRMKISEPVVLLYCLVNKGFTNSYAISNFVSFSRKYE